MFLTEILFNRFGLMKLLCFSGYRTTCTGCTNVCRFSNTNLQ